MDIKERGVANPISYAQIGRSPEPGQWIVAGLPGMSREGL